MKSFKEGEIIWDREFEKFVVFNSIDGDYANLTTHDTLNSKSPFVKGVNRYYQDFSNLLKVTPKFLARMKEKSEEIQFQLDFFETKIDYDI